MKNQNYTATKARANFFEIIKSASEHKTVTEISMSGKIVAKIVPVGISETNWEQLKKDLVESAGIFTEADEKAISQVRLDSKLKDWSW